MSRKHEEEWREFYTEAGFRHGFELGAKAIRAAAAKALSPEQLHVLDNWLAKDVAKWKRDYLREEEPPAPPKL